MQSYGLVKEYTLNDVGIPNMMKVYSLVRYAYGGHLEISRQPKGAWILNKAFHGTIVFETTIRDPTPIRKGVSGT